MCVGKMESTTHPSLAPPTFSTHDTLPFLRSLGFTGYDLVDCGQGLYFALYDRNVQPTSILSRLVLRDLEASFLSRHLWVRCTVGC